MSQEECLRGKGNLMVSHPIIFSDLDGTLLDPETYSFFAAIPALELIKEEGIPLVLCSSKTRAEIEILRRRLGIRHPFVSENGGGIFIPLSYFAEDDIRCVWPRAENINGYWVLILGTSYPILREALEALRQNGFEVKGFGDMSAPEVAEITGLSRKEAESAKRREFDEPFIFHGDEADLSTLLASVQKKGLRFTQGRLYHLMGNHDKGGAVDVLKLLYQRKYGNIITIALGDSPADLPMLEKVDYPIVVRNYRGEHDPMIALPNLMRADGIGPEGWNKAVLEFIRKGF
ncbi:MAG: HAD-IIB family hydrolase [Thermodesulfobacteriota bacterium]